MHITADPYAIPLAPRALARGCAVTIGNFDGVHQGHQALIRRTVERAKEAGLPAVAVTFNPHPLRVLKGQDAPPQLISPQHKLECFADLGINLALVMPFTPETAACTPETFVQTILVERLHTRTLVVGYDYAFGRGRRGNATLLAALGQEHGFVVEQFPALYLHGDIVSSTRIREALHRGAVALAADLLGRPHSVEGVVVKGMNRGGRLLGFPTANLHMDEDLLLPAGGVYAVLAKLGPRRCSLPGICTGSGGPYLKGAANVGNNPTFGEEPLRVETHLLDFHADIYGASFRVYFIERLRDVRRYNGVPELVEQIGRDAAKAREILRHH
jgi:riboflavin kinase/FMN adenylyltransferase